MIITKSIRGLFLVALALPSLCQYQVQLQVKDNKQFYKQFEPIVFTVSIHNQSDADVAVALYDSIYCKTNNKVYEEMRSEKYRSMREYESGVQSTNCVWERRPRPIPIKNPNEMLRRLPNFSFSIDTVYRFGLGYTLNGRMEIIPSKELLNLPVKVSMGLDSATFGAVSLRTFHLYNSYVEYEGLPPGEYDWVCTVKFNTGERKIVRHSFVIEEANKAELNQVKKLTKAFLNNYHVAAATEIKDTTLHGLLHFIKQEPSQHWRDWACFIMATKLDKSDCKYSDPAELNLFINMASRIKDRYLLQYLLYQSSHALFYNENCVPTEIGRYGTLKILTEAITDKEALKDLYRYFISIEEYNTYKYKTSKKNYRIERGKE